MIPVRFFYKSRLFVVGFSLLVLGLGNYLAAVSKVSHYQDVVTDLTPEVPQKQPFLLREEGKPFPSETWERWEIARAKLDYYHVVLSGGRLMMTTGLACMMLAVLKLRRRREQPVFP